MHHFIKFRMHYIKFVCGGGCFFFFFFFFFFGLVDINIIEMQFELFILIYNACM